MTTKDYNALSRLIMYDKIRRFYEEDHQSIRWIARELNLNFRTVKKYLEMDQREFEQFSDTVINRGHILDPYRDFIIGRLSQYQETPAAQMHDWLKENYSDFPKVSPKTVYNYVMKIRQEYGLPKISESERQYSALPETAPGEYAQVDFGQTRLRKSDGTRVNVYFIAILLSHSRYKFIWFQDKPFTVLKTNSIKYKGNTYSLPIGTYRGEDTRVYLSEEGGSLLVKDVDDNLIAKHTIPAGKGQTVINNNHARDTSVSINDKCDYVKSLFTDQNAIGLFLVHIRERYPRYMRDQLAVIMTCVSKYGQKRADEVLTVCVQNKLYSATDFKEIISSSPVLKLDDEVHIKPLGDASSRLMVNVEPNRSSIDVYEDLFKRN